MYSELYQYLIQHKKLSVPEIGTFLLQRDPAFIDFPNKLVHAPAYTFSLQAVTTSNPHLNDTQARQIDEFSLELKNQLNEGKVFEWKALGKIYKNISGNIILEPVRIQTGDPLAANKVLREKAEHFVRVGEDERTSVQMEEILRHDEVKRSYWWAWALAVALVALMFIGWYFSENGLEPSSSANQHKLELPGSRETYKLVE